jgi:hypothetical protein
MMPQLRFRPLAAILATGLSVCGDPTALAAATETWPCSEDPMLVFDASGSMSGDGWGYGSESPSEVSRMDKVRRSLAKVLPRITKTRRVGLITYARDLTINATSTSISRPPRTPPIASCVPWMRWPLRAEPL